MSFFIRPQKWTRQPPHAADIDWGNPLSRGLVIAVNPCAGIDAYSESVAVQSGSSTRSANSFGRCYKSPATQVPGKFTFAVKLAAAFDCTFLTLHRCTTNNGATPAIPTIHLNSAEPVLFSSAGAQSLFSTTGNDSGILTLTNGAPNVLVGVKRVNSQESYLNGVLLDTVVTGNREVGAITELTIGRPGASNNYENVEYALVLYWQRALTRGEIVSVSANPWQLFLPLKSGIHFHVAAAGGGAGKPDHYYRMLRG